MWWLEDALRLALGSSGGLYVAAVSKDSEQMHEEEGNGVIQRGPNTEEVVCCV